jgi:hypothetical protein
VKWFSTLSMRERMICVACVAIVSLSLIVSRGAPAYRGWARELRQQQAREAALLGGMSASVARAELLRDSISTWRHRLDTDRTRSYASLDAMQAAAIAEISEAADTAGMNLEFVRADAYSSDATRPCRQESCTRSIALRTTTQGNLEQTLSFVELLGSSVHGAVVREATIQLQSPDAAVPKSVGLGSHFVLLVTGKVDAATLADGARE